MSWQPIRRMYGNRSVVTHPAASGRPSSAGEARAFLGALVDAGARLLSPGPALADRVLEAAECLRVSGPRVFDLQIAVTALDHGATELWSHDRGFVTLPGLRLVDPLSRRRNLASPARLGMRPNRCGRLSSSEPSLVLSPSWSGRGPP